MAYHLEDIISREFQAEIQESFALSTGFGVVFVDSSGRHIGDGDNFCALCQKINQTPEGRDACTASNQRAIEIALRTNKPSIYICHAGMVNIEVPLFYNDEYVGALTAGQVRCSEPNDYPVDQVYQKGEHLQADFYRTHLEKVKELSIEQIEATARSLHIISKYIMQTASHFKTQQELYLLEKKQIYLENELNLAELEALQKQVTPHFMFNVISVISRCLSMGQYDIAQEMLRSFAQMLRYSLSDIRSYVTLEKEISYALNYVSIQKIRFGDRIQFEVECEEVLKTMLMPYFFLQPLIENAIEHGLLHKEEGGKARLLCKRFDTYDEICLVDNGVGIMPDKLKQIQNRLQDHRHSTDGVGITNSFRRLSYMYDTQLDFTIDSHLGEGTRIIIRIHHNK